MGLKIVLPSILIFFCFLNESYAEIDINPKKNFKSDKYYNKRFKTYQSSITKLREKNMILGNSYIVSGVISLLGGTLGNEISDDQTEQLAYSAFQSIGVASIGYGLYKRKIGDDKEHIFHFINDSKSLTAKEKYLLIQRYYKRKKEREKVENLIKALTHGLVGVLNVYSATQQENERLQTTLYFVGGVNLLAAVSFAF